MCVAAGLFHHSISALTHLSLPWSSSSSLLPAAFNLSIPPHQPPICLSNSTATPTRPLLPRTAGQMACPRTYCRTGVDCTIVDVVGGGSREEYCKERQRGERGRLALSSNPSVRSVVLMLFADTAKQLLCSILRLRTIFSRFVVRSGNHQLDVNFSLICAGKKVIFYSV